MDQRGWFGLVWFYVEFWVGFGFTLEMIHVHGMGTNDIIMGK